MKRGDKTCAKRDEAKLAGQARYFTGNPCSRGHVSDRYTAGGACVDCTRDHNAQLHRERTDERKEYMRARGKIARTSKDLWAAELLRSARKRARDRGIEFDIKPTDLALPEFCPVFGVRLVYDAYEPRANRPSLDRTDNRKGYVADNVRVISYRANQIKNDANADELRQVLHYVESMAETGR